MNDFDDQFRRFSERLRNRLEAGARTYGNSSFERPVADLIGEAMEEAEDIVGWSFLAWVRLDRLSAAVERIEQRGGTDG